MKNKRIQIIISVINFLLGFGIGVYSLKISQSQNTIPRIRIEPQEYNFGYVFPEAKLKHTFAIKNEGNSPLIINRIRKSCSACIKIKLGKRIILPQKKVELEVTFIAPKFRTRVRDFVAIHSNDPFEPIKMVYLVAEVIPNIEITPSLINFGIVEFTELPVTQKLIIYQNSDDVTDVPKIKIVGSGEKFITNFKKFQDKKWILSVILPRNFPLGPISKRIIVELNNKKSSTIEIPILGKVVGDVYAKPDELLFGITEPLKKKNQEIEICSRKEGIKNLNITTIEPSFLKKSLTIKVERINQNYRLLAELDPYKLPGENQKIKGIILLEGKTANNKVWKMEIPILVIGSKMRAKN
ncbi:MAG: DUF1573 domain-containing protein [Candidatus Omnitrophica bacterium]|nr:DUF1573 domain-containing protein [Candidatus Omnitrophota bacterium]